MRFNINNFIELKKNQNTDTEYIILSICRLGKPKKNTIMFPKI